MKTLKARFSAKVYQPLIVCILLCLVFLGVASGAVFVLQTVQAYTGVCEELDGLPGVLQQVGFMPRGTCRFDDDRDKGERANGDDRHKQKKCRPGECTVDGRKGKCIEVTSPAGETMCTCKVLNVSRDHDHDHDHDHHHDHDHDHDDDREKQ